MNWNGIQVAYVQQATTGEGKRVLINCKGLSVGSFSIDTGGAVLGAFVGTIKQSNSPNGRFTALAGVSTLTASVFSTGQFSCNGYEWLLLDITTAGTSGTISVDFSGS